MQRGMPGALETETICCCDESQERALSLLCPAGQGLRLSCALSTLGRAVLERILVLRLACALPSFSIWLHKLTLKRMFMLNTEVTVHVFP